MEVEHLTIKTNQCAGSKYFMAFHPTVSQVNGVPVMFLLTNGIDSAATRTGVRISAVGEYAISTSSQTGKAPHYR